MKTENARNEDGIARRLDPSPTRGITQGLMLKRYPKHRRSASIGWMGQIERTERAPELHQNGFSSVHETLGAP
jgi:hypothetical protein